MRRGVGRFDEGAVDLGVAVQQGRGVAGKGLFDLLAVAGGEARHVSGLTENLRGIR